VTTTIIKMIVLAAVCGLLLSTTYAVSHGQIEHNQQAFEVRQLQAVVGDTSITLQPVGEHYRLLKNDSVYGELRAVTTPDGYNGDIRFWLATNVHGEILGVRVMQHQETPGLGDKLDLAVSQWVLDFNGASLTSHHWDVTKYGGDFDQFSGATITPRAVVLAIAEQLAAPALSPVLEPVPSPDPTPGDASQP
jgi:electron transport complex protein RnfG